jgi:SH3-like domain-containing protein
MTKSVTRQAFVSLPLLRAIERLPESIDIDGTTLRFTGEVTSAPIVLGFFAYRTFVDFDGRGGWVDLSSASSTRTDMSMRFEGLRTERVEHLLLTLRAAMAAPQAKAEPAPGERIDVCRTA